MREGLKKLLIVIALFVIAIAVGLAVFFRQRGDNGYFIELPKEITVYAGQEARLSPVLRRGKNVKDAEFSYTASDASGIIEFSQSEQKKFTGEFEVKDGAKRGSVNIKVKWTENDKVFADVKVNIVDELSEIIRIDPEFDGDVGYKGFLCFEVKPLPKFPSTDGASNTTLQEYMAANARVQIEIDVLDENNNSVKGVAEVGAKSTVNGNTICVPTSGLGSGKVRITVKNGDEDFCKGDKRLYEFTLAVEDPVINSGLLLSADADANGLATVTELSGLTNLSIAPVEEETDLTALNDFPQIKELTLTGDSVFAVSGAPTGLTYYVDGELINDYINDSGWIGVAESIFPSDPLDEGNVWAVIHSEFYSQGKEVLFEQIPKGTLPEELEDNEEYGYAFGGWIRTDDKAHALTGISANSHLFPLWTSASEHPLSLSWWFTYETVDSNLLVTGLTDDWVHYNGTIDKTRINLPQKYSGSTVRGIGENAFAGNEQIVSVYMHAGIRSVADGAFADCVSLAAVYGGESVESVGLDSFVNTVWYNTADSNPNNKFITLGKVIVRYLADRSASITSDMFTSRYTVIGPKAFSGYGNDSTEELTVHLPDYILKADRLAFENATFANLIATGARTVYDETAFSGCKGIVKAEISTAIIPVLPVGDIKNVTVSGSGAIPALAFAYAEKLESVRISSSVTSVASDAFRGTTALSQIVVVGSSASSKYYSINNCLIERVTADGNTKNVLVAGCKASEIPKDGSIAEIGEYAFADCKSLTEVVIPDSVTVVDETAFSGCDFVEKVTSPAFAVGYIPDTALKAVILTSGTSVGARVFEGAPELTEIDICDTVKTVEQYAFHNAAKLEKVAFGTAMTSVNAYAFAGCTALKEITGGDGIYNIGERAFQDTAWRNGVKAGEALCLGKVLVRYVPDAQGIFGCTLPKGVNRIGQHAFEETSTQANRLKEISVPSAITTVEDNAFSNCTQLKVLSLPAYVNIQSKAFIDCTAIEEVTLPATAISSIAGQNAGLKTVTVSGGTTIGESAFTTRKQLETVTIGSSVTTISDNAFSNCDMLSTLVIPASVISVADSAFAGCDSIANLTTSTAAIGKISLDSLVTLKVDGGTEIPDDAFKDASKLLTAEISDTVQSIGLGAFSGCGSLQEITLPFIGMAGQSASGAQTLFGAVFGDAVYNGSTKAEQLYGNTGKAGYYIPDSLSTVNITGGTVSFGAFSDCKNISEINISEVLSSVPDYAFYNCNNLSEYDLKGVGTVGNYAFYGCSKLTELDLSDVETVGNYAFAECIGINEVTFNGSKLGTGAFADCTGLERATAGDCVQSIGAGAFGGCTGLENITVPFVGAGISATSSAALFGYIVGETPCTGSTAVEQYYSEVGKAVYYIPDSLTGVEVTGGDIPYGAFYALKNLTEVTLPEDVKNIGAAAFYGCTNLNGVVIPASVITIGAEAFGIPDSGVIFAEAQTLPVGWAANWYSGNCSVVWNYGGVYGETDGLLWAGLADESVEIYAYTGEETILNLPSRINSKNVTGVSENAFYGNQTVTGVTLPDTVTYVGSNAFGGMTALEYAEVPSSVIRMSASAFEDSDDCVIYVKLPSRPETWNTDWNPSDCLVIWDYAGEFDTQGDYDWALLSDNSISIFGYRGTPEHGVLNLSEVNGHSVRNIMRNTFANLDSADFIILPEDIAYVGENAFKNCNGLTICCKSQAPEGWDSGWNPDPCPVVWNYGDEMGDDGDFYWIKLNDDTVAVLRYTGNDTVVSIPETIRTYPVVSVLGNAFKDNADLFSITLPESLNTIEDNAFNNCLRLTEVVNHSELNLIKGDDGFGGVALNALAIRIGQASEATLQNNQRGYIFLDCEEDGVYLVAYTGEDTELELPEDYDGKPYAVNKYAFYNCDKVVSVSVPQTVTSIGYAAFSGCGALEHMVLPFVGESASEIEASEKTLLGYIFGKEEFTGAVKTEQNYSADDKVAYYIPKSLNSLDIKGGGILYGAFYNCSELVSVTLPETLTEIGAYAFCYCRKLAGIKIPSQVTSIGDSAFSLCSGLERVDIEDLSDWLKIKFSGFLSNPLYHAGNLYVNGELLTKFTVPDGINTVPYYAFYGATCLEEVHIPMNVKVEFYAFNGCTKLNRLIIDDAVLKSNINQFAFGECTAIEYAELPAEIATFIPHDSLVTLFINGGNTVGNEAFKDAVNLKTVTIESNVKEIGEGAFSGCTALSTINGGSGILKAGAKAFEGTVWVKSVESGGKLTLGRVLVRYVGNGKFDLQSASAEQLAATPLANNVVWVYDYAFAGAEIGTLDINALTGKITFGLGAFNGATVDTLQLSSYAGTGNDNLDTLFDGKGTVTTLKIADGKTETTMNLSGNGIKVTTLEASGKSYTKATISGFEKIETVNLGKNKLTEFNADNVEITYLNLYDNSLKSLDLTHLRAWRLALNGNSITALTCSAPNAYVKVIYMPADKSNNALTSLAFTANLPNLLSLDVANNKVSDLTGLETLKNLIELYLGGNPVLNNKTQMEKLNTATFFANLTRLNLGDSTQTDLVLEMVKKSTSLVWLQIYNIGATSDKITAAIKQTTHPNLVYIKISHNGFTTAPSGLSFIKTIIVEYEGDTSG